MFNDLRIYAKTCNAIMHQDWPTLQELREALEDETPKAHTPYERHMVTYAHEWYSLILRTLVDEALLEDIMEKSA